MKKRDRALKRKGYVQTTSKLRAGWDTQVQDKQVIRTHVVKTESELKNRYPDTVRTVERTWVKRVQKGVQK